MAEIKVCDLCANDITEKNQFALSIYDHQKDEEESHFDLCEKCKKAAQTAIVMLVGRKK